jgi:beta-lactam-binding protein with PASTA domain
MRFLRAVILVLGLLAVFLASALIAMRLAIHGREVEVPKLVGLTPQEAQQQLDSRGLLLHLETGFYSAEVPVGRVLSQLPPPGTVVRAGWQVRVSQSLGPQRLSVPDVTGQSRRTAELNLRNRGLTIGSVATLEMPGTPPDRVIAQSPAANAAAGGQKVDLLISK